ncbi:MAG: hypothetical protein ACI38Q_01390 [Candidatus Bruticola sp.]
MSQSTLRRVPILLMIVMVITMVLGLMVAVLMWPNNNVNKLKEPLKPGPYDNRIVPGYRAGFITLGMKAALLEPTLGQASLRPQKNAILYLFPKYNLNVAVSDNLVHSVFVFNPCFVVGLSNSDEAPEKQVRIGADIENALRLFGEKYEAETKGARAESLSDLGQRYTLHYWEDGIHFGVQEHKITYIMITQPIINADLDKQYEQP